jgi:hypothetical protein
VTLSGGLFLTGFEVIPVGAGPATPSLISLAPRASCAGALQPARRVRTAP